MDPPEGAGGAVPELGELVADAVELVARWEERFGAVAPHPSLVPDPARRAAAWEEFGRRMAGNFPFFHPRYAGQMLKPPHRVAVAGYLAAMRVNPNNHSLDGGPATSEMEKEVVADLAAMFHLRAPALGHLSASGTIANLEALWVARQLSPGRSVVFGSNAHSTHRRMCEVLGVPAIEAASDATGHLDLDDVERHCRGGGVGTVVLTAGTTGLGAVDAIDDALALRDRYGVRLHVDAAYGGFHALLAWDEETASSVPAAALRAIGSCDSVVVDPHKHGLQPYGCGAVLYADPAVGALYRHDSPYTYFTSDELHLGEISLECSRAGAAAAALWLTLRTLPLTARSGLGPVLSAGLRAARALAAGISGISGISGGAAGGPGGAASGPLRLHAEPELDIVTYLPWRPGATSAEIGAASRRMLDAGMRAPRDPVWLSTLQVEAAAFAARHPDVPAGEGRDPVTIVRSVLMKPEHEHWVDHLLGRLAELAEDAWEVGTGG